MGLKTILPNDITSSSKRKSLEQYLKKEIKKADQKKKKLIVLNLNLDDFRLINETFGYGTGDKVLSNVEERIRNTVREGFVFDTINDFFIVIPSTLSMEEIEQYIIELMKIFEEPFVNDNYPFYLTCSIGTNIYPDGGTDVSALIKNTTTAMYEAKSLGKNNYKIFTHKMNINTFKTFMLQNDLNQAFLKKEFGLNFLPIVELTTKNLVGAEVLVRWNHLEWGSVRAEDFIPLIKEKWMITELGEWIVNESCKQLNEWVNQGFSNLKLSLNIFPLQLAQTDFASKLKETLDLYGVNPTQLEIEIKEDSVFIQNRYIDEQLDKLKELGIKIAIDNFGSSYTSFNSFKKGIVDTIKLDKFLTNEVVDNKNIKVMVQSIIELSKSLNIKVLATGVEDSAQYSILKKLNCNEAQGYLFSKPIDTEAFEELLLEGKCYPKERNHNEVEIENRRKFYRINLEFPLVADMTIQKIAGKMVDLGTTEILIEDISAGGICFLSTLEFIVRPDLVLSIKTEIMGQEVHLLGHIVRKIEYKKDIYSYGLELSIEEEERESLISLLNKVQVEIRNNKYLQNSRITTENKIKFFNK